MPNPQQKSPPSSGKRGGLRSNQQGHYTRLDAQQVKDRAAGSWVSILESFSPQLAPLLARPSQHGPCPQCGGKDRARVFRDVAETGGFLCHNCGTCADGLATLELMNGWTFPETVRAVAGWLGMVNGEAPEPRTVVTVTTVKPEKDAAAIERRRSSITRTWGESLPASHPDAEPMRLYLASRGLGGLEVPEVIRFHPALPYWHPQPDGKAPVMLGTFPAMLAQVVNVAGEVVTLHRTYLTPDGRKLTEWLGVALDARKKMPAIVPGGSRGAAVRLFPVAERLGVAEGTETALAAHLLSGGTIGVWSAVDAGGLEAIELPREVAEVVIFADRDDNGRGQEAAVKLARRMLAEGRAVKRVLPPLEFGTKSDWNDVLLQGVAHVS